MSMVHVHIIDAPATVMHEVEPASADWLSRIVLWSLVSPLTICYFHVRSLISLQLNDFDSKSSLYQPAVYLSE